MASATAAWHSPPSMPRAEPFDIRLVSARALAPAVRELCFERVDGAPMDFEPGQWVNLLFSTAGEPELKRAYSIASAPDEAPGSASPSRGSPGGPRRADFTRWKWGRRCAPSARMASSRGPATIPAPVLYVATGTGLAPLRSMLHAALAARSTAPQVLLFGTRHEEDILYRDELSALAAEVPQLRYEVTLSRAESSWSGRRGYVQSHVRELYGALAEASAFRLRTCMSAARSYGERRARRGAGRARRAAQTRPHRALRLGIFRGQPGAGAALGLAPAQRVARSFARLLR
jgi:CDP-4-dehydro-6-deoxyglucose reductase